MTMKVKDAIALRVVCLAWAAVLMAFFVDTISRSGFHWLTVVNSIVFVVAVMFLIAAVTFEEG